MGIKAVSIA